MCFQDLNSRPQYSPFLEHPYQLSYTTRDYMAYATFLTTQFQILYYIFDTPQMISNTKVVTVKL